MYANKLIKVLCVVFVLFSLTAKAQLVPLKTTNYPIPATGDVIYVAPEDATVPGSATNTGTSISSPWTLSRAFLDAPTDATVILRGGEYRSVNQEKIKNKITIQAYPGEKPWIKGSEVVTEWTKLATSEVWVHNIWTFGFPNNGPPEDIKKANPLADNRDMVFVDNQSLNQVDTLSKVGSGKFYVDYAAKKIYIGTNPATGRVESTRYASPLMRKNPAGGPEIKVPNNTIIKGIGFTHFADAGLEAVCSEGLHLEDNTFAWNGEYGAKLVAPNSIFKDNTCAYNGKAGLSGNNLKSAIVEDNHCYKNNIENYAKTWGAAGVKVVATGYMKLKNNLIEDNLATGIWLDISAVGCEVSNNTVKKNAGFGIFAELNGGPIIVGNLIIDNTNYGIALSDTESAQIWNNTIVGKGLFVKDTKRQAVDAFENGTFNNWIRSNVEACSWITKNNVLNNNIVVTNALVWMENTAPSSHLQVTGCDFNGYYRTSIDNDANIYKWNKINYTALNNFRAAVSGYEINSIAAYAPSANPFFSDATYTLKASSPAIKAGTPLPANIATLLGLPSGVAVDMGAIQTGNRGAFFGR